MKQFLISFLCIMFLAVSQPAFSHCEIPCGIYDDPVRIVLMEEHVATIEKSMKQIAALSKEEDKNYNQIVRWINNKEDHANKLMHIVTQYFMTQRIKPVAGDSEYRSDYLRKLSFLHQMLVYAMKAKQTTDLRHVERLKELIGEFKHAYFGVAP